MKGEAGNQHSALLSKKLKIILSHWELYLFLLPGLVYFIIFRLWPMWALQIAFQDYNPFDSAKTSFVGFHYFTELFSSRVFPMMLRNTIVISLMNIVFYFPLPILLAIALSEIRFHRFKRLCQSIVYLPHFLSWVVVASFTFFILSMDMGIVNKILAQFGSKISFLSNPNLTWIILTIQSIWRETGWGTILFLAAITTISPTLYEAAAIDGANRFRQVLHITLPGIAGTIVLILILRLGQMFDVSLEQVLLMQNPLVMDVSEVFDTYAYTQGVLRGDISIGMSVGIFKSILNMGFVLTSNYIVKKLGYEGIF
jgi:putative aldouronate transport system permease protein